MLCEQQHDPPMRGSSWEIHWCLNVWNSNWQGRLKKEWQIRTLLNQIVVQEVKETSLSNDEIK